MMWRLRAIGNVAAQIVVLMVLGLAITAFLIGTHMMILEQMR